MNLTKEVRHLMKYYSREQIAGACSVGAMTIWRIEKGEFKGRSRAILQAIEQGIENMKKERLTK